MEATSFDNLFAGSVVPVATCPIVVAPNQSLVVGAVIELNAEGNAVTPTDANKVYGIMTETVVTTDKPKLSVAYLSGEFNENKIVLPDGALKDDYKRSLRKISIFLKSVVKE